MAHAIEGLNDARRLTRAGKLSEAVLALELSELAPETFDYELIRTFNLASYQNA